MKERLLLDGIALNSADVTPGNVELAALIEANFADAGLSFGNGTTMPTSEAANPVPLNRLVEFAFSNVLI